MDLDDAAAAALWALVLTADPSVEHLGLLYQGADGVERTPTQTRGVRNRTKGNFQIPAGSLRGIFHNHPPQDRFGEFSTGDKNEATQYGVPSYISTTTGKFRRYDPQTRRTTDVLAPIPLEEIRKRYLVEGLKK